MIRLPFYLFVCLMLTGCATILNDPEQPVAFDTDPPGAFVSVDGVRMGTTPCVIPVPRKGGDKIISFEMSGYKTEMMNMRNTLDAALAGNILLGGFVGLAIDGVSGRGGGYQKSLKIILGPGSGNNDRRARLSRAGVVDRDRGDCRGRAMNPAPQAAGPDLGFGKRRYRGFFRLYAISCSLSMKPT